MEMKQLQPTIYQLQAKSPLSLSGSPDQDARGNRRGARARLAPKNREKPRRAMEANLKTFRDTRIDLEFTGEAQLHSEAHCRTKGRSAHRKKCA